MNDPQRPTEMIEEAIEEEKVEEKLESEPVETINNEFFDKDWNTITKYFFLVLGVFVVILVILFILKVI